MKKNIISASLGALVSVSLFAMAYYSFEQSLINKFLPRDKIEAIIYFPMLVIAPFCALAIHELGHLITGISLGQRLKLFIVGFLGIMEDSGKIKIFINKNLAYYGGIVVVVPKSIEDINHKVFAKILIAGPIMSLVYGILCLIIFIEFDTYFNSFFALTSLTSLGLFFATTIPNKSGLMYTDRKRYQRLSKKGVTQDAEIAMYQLISQGVIDNSFKNIDISKTYILEKDTEMEMRFWAEYIRYLYYTENEIGNQKQISKSNLMNFKSTIGEDMWKTLKIE